MKWIATLAALSGAMAVAAGAFGAHGATGHAVEWLRIGGQYQGLHAVAALVALRMGAKWPAILFVAGGLLFAGSLYALALGAPGPLVGPITPLGGLSLIIAWLWLAWDTVKQ